MAVSGLFSFERRGLRHFGYISPVTLPQQFLAAAGAAGKIMQPTSAAPVSGCAFNKQKGLPNA